MDNPHYTDNEVTLYHGDCLAVLTQLPASSVDAVVTDPPYGLSASTTAPVQVAETVGRWTNGERDYTPAGAGFMGRSWDAFVPPVAVWDECLRVLKPGGHLVAFAGTRTVDLMGLAIRLAGFEIRDGLGYGSQVMAWCYATGFPKSIDPANDPRFCQCVPAPGIQLVSDTGESPACGTCLKPIAPAGLGTGLKPAWEPVLLARKPLSERTVAANLERHGTGALNIDACRESYPDQGPALPGTDLDRPPTPPPRERRRDRNGVPRMKKGDIYGSLGEIDSVPHELGRWPANVLLDEAQARQLDGQEPGASQFFFIAKPDSGERPRVNGIAHETVKPLELMRRLVRLACPPGGIVLEPFAGSGTTVEACLLEGLQCVAVEREADYLPLIESRIARRRDAVRAVKLAGDDAGLFALFEDGAA